MRIRRTLDLVRERIPELERPAGALRAPRDGSGRVALRHQGILFEPDGQMLLDFERAGAGSGAVTVLGARSVDQERALERAAELFERGCRLDSDRATWSEAIEAYRRAIELDPEFADALCNLGSVYYSQHRRQLARACFERAIACCPEHLEARLNLATLLEEEGYRHAALRHYKDALAVDALHGDTHVSLALLYEKLGLRRRARDHWRRYLQLEPSGAWGDVARRRLEEP